MPVAQPFRITPSNLAASIVGAPQAAVDAWAEPLSNAAVEFGITTIHQVVALLASISNESHLTHLREDWVYPAWRAAEIFGLSAEDTARYQQSRETWFEFVYGYKSATGRMLGNDKPGDGAKYYGLGIDGITGKANCAAVSKATGVDFVANPDRLLDPVDGSRAVCAFWKINHITDMIVDGSQLAFLHAMHAMNSGLSDNEFLTHHLQRWFECRRGCGVDPTVVTTPVVVTAPGITQKQQNMNVQAALNVWLHSLPFLATDGDIGPLSSRLLTLYQKDKGLPDSRIPDATTLASLGVKAAT